MRERSLIGEEEGAQRVMAERLSGLGFRVQRIEIEPPGDDSDPTWGYPPSSYDGRTCVVGRIDGAGGGRSLHLSGHVDVVPVESAELWDHDPWAGEVSDGRVWGRGAGDMKAGLAAYVIGVAAFLEVCGRPPGDLLFSSVIEEECTGNGMKAVLAAGCDAEGTLIGEPSGLQLMHAGVGVIWARLTARSGGAHPGFSTGGSSSEAILRVLAGLRELEQRINERAGASDETDHLSQDEVFFAAHEHPFRLNVGSLSGGVWPSSAPARAQARIRLGFGRELTPTEAQRLVAESVQAAAPGVEVAFEGFRAPAYCDRARPRPGGRSERLARDAAWVAARAAGAPRDHRRSVGRRSVRLLRPGRRRDPRHRRVGPSNPFEAVAAVIAITIAGWQKRW